MKIRNFIALLSFSALTVIFSSCGDSYAPITLTSSDGKTIYKNNDTISLIKFTEGEEFTIKGGNGIYLYEIKYDNKILNVTGNYSSEKNLLTLKPKSEGESFIYIRDTEDNSSRFLLQVKNMNRLYSVEDINATAEGGNLTQDEEKEIISDILRNSKVRESGRFEFYYITKDFDSGTLKIYPSENDNESITTFFYQKEPYFNKEGNKVFEFNIFYSLNSSYPNEVLYLTEKNNEIILTQNLTDKYKGKYGNKLENATIEYILKSYSEKIYPTN